MNTSRTIAAFTLFLLAPACGSEPRTPEGKWTLDGQAFAEHMAGLLIEKGVAKEGHRAQLVVRLRSAQFALDLAADGTFTARQSLLGQNRTYKGSWELAGGALTLEQSHEDGEEVADTMSGTYRDGALTLVEEEKGMRVEMQMRRATPAAPR